MPYYDDTWNTVFTQYDYRMQDASGNLTNSGTGADPFQPSSGASHTYQQTGFAGGLYAVQFDGSAYFATANGSQIQENDSAGTIAAWINTSSGSENIFMTTKNSSPFETFATYIDSSNQVQLRLSNSNGNYYHVQDATDGSYVNPADGNWHLIVWRQKNDGTGAELWVDNVSQALTQPVSAPTGIDNDSWISDCLGASHTSLVVTYLGYDHRSSSDLFTGKMGGIGFTDTAITDEQVSSLYTESVAVFGTKTLRRRGRRLYADLTAV